MVWVCSFGMEIILLVHNSLSLSLSFSFSIRSNLLLCPSSLALLLCLYVGGFNVISLLFLSLVLPRDSHPRKGKEECLLLSLFLYTGVCKAPHLYYIITAHSRSLGSPSRTAPRFPRTASSPNPQNTDAPTLPSHEFSSLDQTPTSVATNQSRFRPTVVQF